MPRPVVDDLDLRPGERIVGTAQRDRRPAWATLALLAMGLLVYGVTDTQYGWGVMFLGMVALAFLGSILTSTRLVVTDRRVVRTNWLGRKEIAKPTLDAQPGAFGDTLLIVGQGLGERMTVRFVKNAKDLAR